MHEETINEKSPKNQSNSKANLDEKLKTKVNIINSNNSKSKKKKKLYLMSSLILYFIWLIDRKICWNSSKD